MNNNFYKTAFFVLLTAIVAGGVVYYTQQDKNTQLTTPAPAPNTTVPNTTAPVTTPKDAPQSNEADHWKVYTNDDIGIQIEYSKDFVLDQESSLEASFKHSEGREFFCKEKPECAPPTLKIKKISANNLENYISEILKKDKNAVIVEKDIAISNKKAKRVVFPGMGAHEGYLIQMDGYILEFSSIYATGGTFKIENFFNFDTIELQ